LSDLEAVLFDLDGTLIDSAADLGAALNAVLMSAGLAPLLLSQIRPLVSDGSHALIELGFGQSRGVEHEHRRQQLLQSYERFSCVQTSLFPGMETILGYLESHAIPWGIVTNKPGYLTEPIVRTLGLKDRAGCVVSGDTVENSKPHPQPLWHAARLLAVRPEHCLYVGDARRDIEAGNKARMHTAVATYGFITPGHDPAQWGADWLACSPASLLAGLMKLLA